MNNKSIFLKSLFALLFVLIILVFYLDLVVPAGLSISILYLIPLLATFWWRRIYGTIALTAIATCLCILGILINPEHADSMTGWANCVRTVVLLWITAFIIGVGIRSEKRLLNDNERYAQAFRGANDGLWVWNRVENTLFLSPRWKAILGWEDHEIGSDPQEWMNRVHPDDIQSLNDHIQSHLKMKISHLHHEHRILHKDGTYKWVLIRGQAVWDDSGSTIRIAGSLTDISTRKMEEEQFKIQAFHDPLTELFNRRYFMERLEMELNSARRYKYSFSVCICDIDYLKKINDSYGHRAGDKVLARFGRLLKNILRSENIAGRYGGDEFCIIFPHSSAKSASESLERIRSHFEKIKFENSDGSIFSLSATFGIADLTGGIINEKELLEAADKALYEAKADGRNRIVINDGSLQLQLFEPETRTE